MLVVDDPICLRCERHGLCGKDMMRKFSTRYGMKATPLGERTGQWRLHEQPGCRLISDGHDQRRRTLGQGARCDQHATRNGGKCLGEDTHFCSLRIRNNLARRNTAGRLHESVGQYLGVMDFDPGLRSMNASLSSPRLNLRPISRYWRSLHNRSARAPKPKSILLNLRRSSWHAIKV